jgi:hypothetical protein
LSLLLISRVSTLHADFGKEKQILFSIFMESASDSITIVLLLPEVTGSIRTRRRELIKCRISLKM